MKGGRSSISQATAGKAPAGKPVQTKMVTALPVASASAPPPAAATTVEKIKDIDATNGKAIRRRRSGADRMMMKMANMMRGGTTDPPEEEGGDAADEDDDSNGPPSGQFDVQQGQGLFKKTQKVDVQAWVTQLLAQREYPPAPGSFRPLGGKYGPGRRCRVSLVRSSMCEPSASRSQR